MKRIFMNIIIIIVLLLTLTSCSTNSKNLEKKMNEKGYYIFNLHDYTNFIEGISPNGVDKYFAFSKGTSEEDALNNAKTSNEYLVVVYYIDKNCAEDSYNNIENENDQIILKISNKCIYYGTEQAVKDFENL